MSEQQLRQALEELADQAPAPDVVDRAWRQARRTRRWRTVLAGLAAAVVVVAGVTFVPPLVGASSPLPIGSDTDNMPFATHHGRIGFAGFIPHARLSLVDGCVYIRATGGNFKRMPVVFPDNTKWNPATQQITLDRPRSTVTIGDIVAVGGGDVAASYADHIPTGCHYDKADPGAFAAVSSIGKVQ